MRSFLVGTLGILNSLTALLIIVGCGIAGANIASEGHSSTVLGAIGGALCGLIVASILCGVIATLIDIRETLVDIKDALSRRGGQESKVIREPSF